MSSERALLPPLSGLPLRIGAGASIGLHALLLALLLWQPWTLLMPQPPDVPAEIELLVGGGAQESGMSGGPPPAPDSRPAERQQQPPQPPKDDAAVALPQPAATQAPPVPAQKPRPAADPTVRLGDGIAAPAAERAGPLRDRAAEAEPGNVAPVYPPESELRRETGRVQLALHVDEFGRVRQVDIVRSSGSPRLDEAARQAVSGWHFRPAFKNGLPVPSLVPQGINFSR